MGDEQVSGFAGGLGRRLLVYGVVAAAVVIVTFVAILIPEGRLSEHLGFGSIESSLDTILLVLAIALLLIFVARLVTWAMGGSDDEAAEEVAPLPSPPEDRGIVFDGTTLTIMGATFDVPDVLLSMVSHVLEEHAEEITRSARRIQASAKEEDLGGVNWVFAFTEVMGSHLDEAKSAVYGSMASSAGQVLMAALAASASQV